MFSWIKLQRELSPAALTVRAQTVSPNDNGKLKWDRFFPRRNVNSVDLADIVTLDDRATADRRDWDGQGRRIPLVSPSWRELSIIPIEAEHIIGEQEMQKLNEGAVGNAAVLQQVLMTSIPDRINTLAAADYRRVEVDAFSAWANGTITVKSPTDGATYTVSFGFDSARYQTAGTAWNDPSVNAYDLFVSWLQDAEDAIGGVEGVALRRASLNAIMADAPVSANVAVMTQSIMENLITDVIGNQFRFEIMENSVDVFDDGGLTKTRTKIWTAHKIAAIPMGMQVGTTAFAPVVRAMDIDRNIPGAGVDVRGATAYHFEENDGKQLKLQVQLNALPVPDEQVAYVIDIGV